MFLTYIKWRGIYHVNVLAVITLIATICLIGTGIKIVRFRDSKSVLSNVKSDTTYYEIKDNNTLSIYIELKLDNLEEKEIKVENVETDRCIEEEPTVMNNTGYLTYKIYIVKENDTIESIISKYSVSKELLDSYNDLSDIKLGDKIIIPTNVKSS